MLMQRPQESSEEAEPPISTSSEAAFSPTQKPSSGGESGGGSGLLNAFGKSWRLLFALAVFGVLTTGQFVNTNDWFPLGTLSQYSYGRPLDTPTRSIGVLAINEDGEEVRVPLSTSGVGIGRAEVEGQVNLIIEDPSKLEALARAWHGLHPDKPQYTELTMIRVTRYVKNGIPTGEMDTEQLATWTVQGNYGRGTK